MTSIKNVQRILKIQQKEHEEPNKKMAKNLHRHSIKEDLQMEN